MPTYFIFCCFYCKLTFFFSFNVQAAIVYIYEIQRYLYNAVVFHWFAEWFVLLIFIADNLVLYRCTISTSANLNSFFPLSNFFLLSNYMASPANTVKNVIGKSGCDSYCHPNTTERIPLKFTVLYMGTRLQAGWVVTLVSCGLPWASVVYCGLTGYQMV